MESNRIHNSGHYGIDLDTGTHDMIIRNNTVYQNNGTAIICSVDCYNIMFDNNHVYDNNGVGVSLVGTLFTLLPKTITYAIRQTRSK